MAETPTDRNVGSTWASLRRRKLVQWGLAYAAGAWVLLQVVGFAADAFAWQPLIKQLALLGLVLGLPVVLALAWYHGDRGQQRVTGSELAVLTLLLFLGGGLLWLYAHRSSPMTSASTAATPLPPSAVTDPRPSIAVLPFENRSDVQKDTYFVDGIHDDILTQLSKISALRVISRTSVERFRKTDLSVQEIAHQLGVTSILEGGVQRGGDSVRINVQLIDAGKDAHLWAETYDRELTAANIFAIQGELATSIAGVLKATLTPAERGRTAVVPTQNLDAWSAFQLGRQRMAKRNTADLAVAERLLRKAVHFDPQFALAWVGLADTLAMQVYYGSRPLDTGLSEADDAVNRALKLNPNLAEAWASAGMVLHSRLQLERAEQMFRRAIALNPNYAPAHHWLSLALTDFGRRDEALTEAERAVALDPLSAIVNNLLGLARMNVGRFNEALVALGQAIEIDPTLAIAYTNIGNVYAYGLGRLDTALPWYERSASLDPGNSHVLAALAVAYWEIGDDAEARRWLSRTLALGDGTASSNYQASLLSIDRGDIDSARKLAKRASELDPWTMFLIRALDIRSGDYAAARARYAAAFPGLFATPLSPFKGRDAFAAIDLALVLQHAGEDDRAKLLLDRSETFIRTYPRMGLFGYGISDVVIHALRGEKRIALAKLREAERAGWLLYWRYYRDYDPNLASIRNEPEFKAVFADIERDMARQRAALAARPKDAPLDLQAIGT
jgi:TolB-like protein/Tfp pilus assembly protein PilF